MSNKSCSSANCGFLITGIVPRHCCMMCSKIPGQHGVRCRHLTSDSPLCAAWDIETEPFDTLLKEHLRGKCGVYIGDIPPDIKDKRFPRSQGILKACQRVPDVYTSPDHMAYAVETVHADSFDPTLARFPIDAPSSIWTQLSKQFEDMLGKPNHPWTYEWTFTRIATPNALYCLCECYLNEEASPLLGYAYGEALEIAAAAVMDQILDRWRGIISKPTKQEQAISVHDHSPGTSLPGSMPPFHDFCLSESDCEDTLTDEMLKDGIMAIGPGRPIPTEKFQLRVFKDVLSSDEGSVVQFMLALASRKITSGKLYSCFLKRLANELVNNKIEPSMAEKVVAYMLKLDTDLSAYTRKLLHALIDEEIEACKIGTTSVTSFDLRLDAEKKKAVPAERQIDALVHLEKGKYFDPIVAHIVSDSYKVFRVASVLPVEDCQLVLDQFRKLCSKSPGPGNTENKSTKRSMPLTTCQQKVVDATAKNTFTCVRGPPGTGKTYTACAVIDNWVQNDLRVLVVAQTNAACEHLANQLARLDVEAVRLGASMSVEDLLAQPAFVEKLAGSLKEFEEEGQKEKPKLMPFLKIVVEKASVVITSCIAAGHPGLLSKVRFNRVLMDEAGQITDPTAAVPLWWGAEGVCLIGDEKQLPPTILANTGSNPLKISLFERLIVDGVVCGAEGTFLKLSVQRRMHPSLAEFPRWATYNDQELYDDPCVSADRPQIPGFYWPNGYRSVFVDVRGQEHQESGGFSFQNIQEADVVCKLVRHFIDNGNVPQEHIAVISGYAAQVKLLKARLVDCSMVKVATADSFQGLESPLVIFSTVRSGRDVGFLASTQRCNVIMTRAQRGLIVVGCRHTLLGEPIYWKPWVQHMDNRSCTVMAARLPHYMQHTAYPIKRALPRNDSHGNANSQAHRWRVRHAPDRRNKGNAGKRTGELRPVNL